MAVFIELSTDAFQNNQTRLGAGGRAGGRAGSSSVRRPLRGLEVKEDTYALLRVIRADGSEIPLVDSGSVSGQNPDYANFILQMVQEARMEKHQIVETFGEPYIFFFGEQPRFLDVQALLVDSHDFNWEAEWWENYERHFRGTKLVEMGARCYLFYDDNIVEGYMLNAQSIKVADQPLQVQLAFRFFITGYQNISLIGNPNFPLRTEVRAFLAQGGLGENAIRLPRDDNGLVRLPNNTQPGAGSIGQFDPNTGGFLLADNTPAPPGVPLTAARDLIIANQDEWTGAPVGPPNLSTLPWNGVLHDPRNQAMVNVLEVRDLPTEMIQTAGFYGAAISDGPTLVGMGLGPSFGYGINGQPYDQAVLGARQGFLMSSSSYSSITASSRYGVALGLGLRAGVGTARAVPAFGYLPPTASAAFLTARSVEQQRLARARAALMRGRQRPFGSLNPIGALGYDPYNPVRQRDGFLFNTPLSPGQAGNVSAVGGFVGVRAGVGIGAGGGVYSRSRTSAFSVVSVPGQLTPGGVTVGVGVGAGLGAGAGAGIGVSVF